MDTTHGPPTVDVVDGFHERAETMRQMADSARYCYEDFEQVDAKAAKKHLRPVILEPLVEVRARFAHLGDWSQTAIHAIIETVAAEFEINMGKLGQPLRVAATGGPVSPPIDVTLWLVGKDRTIRRIDRAIDMIRARAAVSNS